jgi:hypothetical protein
MTLKVTLQEFLADRWLTLPWVWRGQSASSAGSKDSDRRVSLSRLETTVRRSNASGCALEKLDSDERLTLSFVDVVNCADVWVISAAASCAAP